MEGRAALARHLVESRAAVAETVLEHLGPAATAPPSALIVRSLVSALGHSVEASSPDAVVSWARMAHSGCGVSAIHALVSASCEVAAKIGEPMELDFSQLLVFLEIVKANVAEAFPLAPGPFGKAGLVPRPIE